MFAFFKNMFCSSSCNDNASKEREELERKQKAAHEQDRKVRESLSEKQIDKEVRDTMAASDPVAKY